MEEAGPTLKVFASASALSGVGGSPALSRVCRVFSENDQAGQAKRYRYACFVPCQSVVCFPVCGLACLS